MRCRGGIALAALLGACTTVVQEPADLDGSRIEALRIEQEDATSVRLRSPASWADPGQELFVTNRLTGASTVQRADDQGVLDVTLAGVESDVYAVSLFADSLDPPQIVGRAGATLRGWGWGFSREAGCAHGEFPVADLVETPAAHAPDAYDVCFAAAVLTPDGAGHDVLAVGTSSLHLELVDAPVVRARLRVDHAASVVVQISATGADGHDRVYEGTEDFLDVEAGLFSTRARDAGAYVSADGAPLGAGDVVRGIFFRPPAGHALELHVDDVVFESARPPEEPF